MTDVSLPNYGERTDGARSRFAEQSCFGTSLLVLLILLAAPASAFADRVFVPFAGVSFGSEETEKVTTFGVSLAAMGGGVFGFELDLAQTSDTKTDTVLAANTKATTLTGNIIIGFPLGAVRPYIVGGLGWMRTKLTPDGQDSQMDSTTSDGLGVDFGGGLMGFFSDAVGARVDIRYIRAATAGRNVFDFQFQNFNFIRFTGGLVLRF